MCNYPLSTLLHFIYFFLLPYFDFYIFLFLFLLNTLGILFMKMYCVESSIMTTTTTVSYYYYYCYVFSVLWNVKLFHVIMVQFPFGLYIYYVPQGGIKTLFQLNFLWVAKVLFYQQPLKRELFLRLTFS